MDILKAATSNRRRKLSKAGAKAVTDAARHNMIQDLQELENRAHHLGLHVTAHALNRAKNALGWEIAGDTEKAGQASRDERPVR